MRVAQAKEGQGFFDSPKGHRWQRGWEFLLLLWIQLGSNYCRGAEGVQPVQKTRGICVLCRSRRVWCGFLGDIQSHLGNNVTGRWKIFTFLCALPFKLSTLQTWRRFHVQHPYIYSHNFLKVISYFWLHRWTVSVCCTAFVLLCQIFMIFSLPQYVLIHSLSFHHLKVHSWFGVQCPISPIQTLAATFQFDHTLHSQRSTLKTKPAAVFCSNRCLIWTTLK